MRIKKIFKAEVAHRLVTSYSKRCQSFHGHSYTFEVILESPSLNKDAMLMDFGEVKTKLNNFIDSFDHSMVLFQDDPFTPQMVAIMEQGHMRYILVPYNPTAEKMAEHITAVCAELGLPIDAVKVNETLTGQAEYQYKVGVPIEVDPSRVIFAKAVKEEWK